MDFSNERYVRVYTRDTVTWKLLDWRARAVLLFLLRKVDRSGVIEVGTDGVEGLAATLELPLDLVDPGIAQLSARGVVAKTAEAFVLPKFIEAQEAVQSDRLRAKEYRERRRDRALGVVTERDVTVTNRDDSSRNVRPRDDSSLQPDQPSRPAFQARSEKEESSLSSAPARLVPAGRAEAEIEKRIAAGELSKADVARSIQNFEDYAVEQQTTWTAAQSDAALARWIRKERSTTRSSLRVSAPTPLGAGSATTPTSDGVVGDGARMVKDLESLLANEERQICRSSEEAGEP